MPIKSFRGKLTDGSQETIHLHTNNGSTGYRIVKFEGMPAKPGTVSSEHVLKIFKIEQTTPLTDPATVDFSDNTLIAAALVGNSTNTQQYTQSNDTVVVFDNEIFNQDIYVTHVDNNGTEACNFHIELEQIKLDLNQNTVATLKDIRNIASQ